MNHNYSNVEESIKDQGFTKGLVEVGENCWIGANVFIGMGVKIGRNSIIAAGSIVVKNVPDFSLVVGNPGRVIKKYNFESKEWERIPFNVKSKKEDYAA